jgi:hypothetical protein
MMSYWDDVNPRSVSEASDGFSEFALGDNEAFIDKVEEKISESGNEMLVITFAKNNGATIKHFIVDGEWKLSKLKQLYTAFNIPIGETNTKKWLGKTGIVVCKEGKPYNGKCYNQVSYLRPLSNSYPANNQPRSQQTRPPVMHKAPEPDMTPKNQPDNADFPGDGFDDDIPF